MKTDESWYEKLVKDDLFWVPRYIQELIDLYCFDSEQFKTVGDITAENLGDFWKIILKQYQYYNIELDNLDDLTEALGYYFDYAYELDRSCYEFSGYRGHYPYPENDRRNLAMCIGFYCDHNPIILPEDVPKLIDYLDTPSGDFREAADVIDQYMSQFDNSTRAEASPAVRVRNIEYNKRFAAIRKERLEAIEKRRPLPIKPMSIKLDSCYKVASPKKL